MDQGVAIRTHTRAANKTRLKREDVWPPFELNKASQSEAKEPRTCLVLPFACDYGLSILTVGQHTGVNQG